MAPFNIVLITAAAMISVQIMETSSTEIYTKRCASKLHTHADNALQSRPATPLQLQEPETAESRTSIPAVTPNPVPKSSSTPAAPSAKPAVNEKLSADSAKKSLSSVQKSPADSVQRSLSSARKSAPSSKSSVSKSPNNTPAANTNTKFSPNSFSLFKIPLQLISSLLKPLLPAHKVIKENTSSVVAPQINFNIPLTISTIHSNSVPCGKPAKNNLPNPCSNDQSELATADCNTNVPCSDQQPANNVINNSPPGNIQPGPHSHTLQKKPADNSHHTILSYFLCNFLLQKISDMSFCQPPNNPGPAAVVADCEPVTAASTVDPVNPPVNPPVDTTPANGDDPPPEADSTSTISVLTTPATVQTEPADYVTIPPTLTTSKYTTVDPINPINPASTTAATKCPSPDEPNTLTTTPTTAAEGTATDDSATTPCVPVGVLNHINYHFYKHHKLCLPAHIPKTTSRCKTHLLPITSNAVPVVRPAHSAAAVPSKLHPAAPNRSFYDNFIPLFKHMIYKPNDFDRNSQELLVKLLKDLNINSTSSIANP